MNPGLDRNWDEMVMKCEWVRNNAPLYIYDELEDDARYEFEQIGRAHV